MSCICVRIFVASGYQYDTAVYYKQSCFNQLLMQLDILLNGNPVDALAVIVHKEKAYSTGKRICTKLGDNIHRYAYHAVALL